MSLDTEQRPADAGSDSLNPGQKHVDDEFAALTSAEHLAKDGQSGDRGEAKSGFFNPGGDANFVNDLKGKAVNKAVGTGAAEVASKAAGPAGTVALAAARLFLKKHGKKAGAGAGITATVAIIAFALSVAAPSLYIKHEVENLRKHFYAASNQAVQNEVDNLFAHYIAKKVLPGYSSCGSTTSKDCMALDSSADNLVSKLYKTWRDTKFETKLAEGHGIEFRFDKTNKTWTLRSPTRTVDIGPNGEKLFTEKNTKDMSEMRKEAFRAIDKEAMVKKIVLRYKIGRLLDKKYGAKRCLVVCMATKPLRTATKDASEEMKKYFARQFLARVILPRYQMQGSALLCLIESSCKPDKPDTAPTNESSNGRKTSAFANEASSTVTKATDVVAAGDEALLKELADKMVSEGLAKSFTRLAMAKFAPKLATTAGANAAVDSIPVIGQVIMAAQLIDGLDSLGRNVGPKLKAISYSINALSAVNMWSMFSSINDESAKGNISLAQLGSFNRSLTDGVKGDPSEPEIVGGTARATENPMYSTVMNEKPTGASSKNYLCVNKKPVPTGRLECPDMRLGTGNEYATIVSTTFTLFADSPLAVMSGYKSIVLLGSTINWLLSLPMDVFAKIGGLQMLDDACNNAGISDLESISNLAIRVSGTVATGGLLNGYCELQQGLAEAMKVIMPAMMSFMANYMITPVVTENMSGGRIQGALIMGASVAGNDHAHALGGQKISPAVAAELRAQEEIQQKFDFQQRPLLARMFSTDTSYSMLSTIIDSVPYNIRTGSNKVAVLVSNPIKLIGSTFSTLFNPHVNAAYQFEAETTYGITPYGYPSGSAVFSEDPEKMWTDPTMCNGSSKGKFTEDWNEAGAAAADENGQPVNVTTNPCLLIEAAVGAGGGKYNTDLLTSDDMKVINGDSGGGASSGGSGSLPTGTAQELATKLLPFINSGKISCNTSQGASCSDIQNTANGTPIGGSCNVAALDPKLVGMMLELANMGHTIVYSSMCSDHGPTGGAGHSAGKAADFNVIDGVWMGRTGGDQGATWFWTDQREEKGRKLNQDVASFMPKDTNTGFGQINCHATYDFLAGYSTFNDTCHHQHISVDGH